MLRAADTPESETRVAERSRSERTGEFGSDDGFLAVVGVVKPVPVSAVAVADSDSCAN